MKIKTTKTNLALLFLFFSSVIFAQEIKTRQQVISETKAGIVQVTPEQLKIKMDSIRKFILLDVRTEREHDAGYISGSIWIPRGFLEFKIQEVIKSAETEIIVYCKGGNRSMVAVKTLQQLGYKNVFNLEGGINAWGSKGYSLFNMLGEIKIINFGKKDPDISTYDVFKE